MMERRLRLRARAIGALLLAATLAPGCTPREAAQPTPVVVADCLSPTGAIVACPTAGLSLTPSGEATGPTPSPTAPSFLGAAGEAVIVSVEPLVGKTLEVNVIGLDGSSRVLGRVPNPQAGLPAVADCGEGETRDVRVSEAGFVAVPVWYCEEIPRLTVSDLRSGTPITTTDSWWFAFGPGDRLALSLPSGEQGVMRELATYELANPSAAPGVVTMPPDVQPLGWLAGAGDGFAARRRIGEDADDRPIDELGILRDGTFSPGEAKLYLRTGIERPPAAGPSLAEAYDRLMGIDPEVGGSNLRDAVVDPSGIGAWLLLSGDGALLLARWIGPEEPVAVARLTPTPAESIEEFGLRIVGISPEGSRIALGDADVRPTSLTRLVDTATGEVTIHRGAFAGWADTP